MDLPEAPPVKGTAAEPRDSKEGTISWNSQPLPFSLLLTLTLHCGVSWAPAELEAKRQGVKVSVPFAPAFICLISRSPSPGCRTA